MFHKNRWKAAIAVFALVGALAFAAGEASAKVGGGKSFGSRGSKTFTAPPPTATAPGGAAPIERSMTQAPRPGTVGQTAGAPAAPARGGMFGGFGGGLLAGFLGAGLIGMMFGGGLFSGLTGGGFAAFLGLLLQVGLVVIVARLAWAWWQRRQAPTPAYANANGPSMRDIGDRLGGNAPRQSFGGGAAPVSDTVTVSEEDFNTFEKKLVDVETAYAEENLGKLKTLVTPEVLSYLAEDLAENTSRGVVNEIRDIKLLQGDLAEAWREGGTEYASVAMRYSMVDITRERAGGKIVEGSETPKETTEVWTFMRSGGGDWILSAIQEA